jgi:hypothetical protein
VPALATGEKVRVQVEFDSGPLAGMMRAMQELQVVKKN